MTKTIYAIMELYVGCGGGSWSDMDIYCCYENREDAVKELEQLNTDNNYDYWVKEVKLIKK